MIQDWEKLVSFDIRCSKRIINALQQPQAVQINYTRIVKTNLGKQFIQSRGQIIGIITWKDVMSSIAKK